MHVSRLRSEARQVPATPKPTTMSTHTLSTCFFFFDNKFNHGKWYFNHVSEAYVALPQQTTHNGDPLSSKAIRKSMLGVAAKQTVVKYPGNQSCTPRFIQPSYCTNYDSTFSDTSSSCGNWVSIWGEERRRKWKVMGFPKIDRNFVVKINRTKEQSRNRNWQSSMLSSPRKT